MTVGRRGAAGRSGVSVVRDSEGAVGGALVAGRFRVGAAGFRLNAGAIGTLLGREI